MRETTHANTELVESTVRVLEERCRSIVLQDSTSVQDQHLVKGNDRSEPMCNDQEGCILKSLGNGRGDQFISLEVNARGGLEAVQ